MESSIPDSSAQASLLCMADAQRLNNIATKYIETGNYENAISTLQDALRLWEEHRLKQVFNKSDAIWYSCNHCTLDRCIVISEQQNNYLSNQSKGKKCSSSSSSSSNNGSDGDNTRNHATSGRGNKRRRISTHKSIALEEGGNCEDTVTTNYKRKTCRLDTSPNSHNDGSNQGYTYQNPIRIPKNHYMGATSFFIIMFNLTLANHLKVLNGAEIKKDDIQGVLHLYELIFEYWSRLQADCNVEIGDDTATNSLRFVMILFNNMSQMYRMVDNPTKQRQCLQQLESIVMIAVEWNTRFASAGQRTISEDSVHCHENFQQSIDGFLTNVMPPQQCAQAA